MNTDTENAMMSAASKLAERVTEMIYQIIEYDWQYINDAGEQLKRSKREQYAWQKYMDDIEEQWSVFR